MEIKAETCARCARLNSCKKVIKIAIEAEGGVWTGGRHTRGGGFERDCEKYAEAVLLGWRVFRFTSSHIQNGYAISVIKRALLNSQ